MGDEDRPRPMVGKKPCEKRPNAADQFEEHQVEYERRGTQTLRRDWETHNSTYPKLRDELEKRRSIAHCRIEEQSSQRHGNQTYQHDVVDCKNHSSQDSQSRSTDSRRSRTPSGIPSLSSYNSYGSINQEPMVSDRSLHDDEDDDDSKVSDRNFHDDEDDEEYDDDEGTSDSRGAHNVERGFTRTSRIRRR